jgi:hypothetical protein
VYPRVAILTRERFDRTALARYVFTAASRPRSTYFTEKKKKKRRKILKEKDIRIVFYSNGCRLPRVYNTRVRVSFAIAVTALSGRAPAGVYDPVLERYLRLSTPIPVTLLRTSETIVMDYVPPAYMFAHNVAYPTISRCHK